MSDSTKRATKLRRWYAVRCCCTPHKILGFLAIDTSDKSVCIVRDHLGAQHTIEIRLISQMTCVSGRLINPILPEESGVEFQEDREFAIYSDDRSIEFWRTIPGFIEVSEA